MLNNLRFRRVLGSHWIILSYLYRDGGTAARHEIWLSTFQQTLLSLV
jgi:hypothetical protein